MNYIYNIYLNFNKECYEFYEWKNEDNILHIKKIPIIKVNTNTFKEIIGNTIILDNKEFELIKNKTECFNKKNISAIIITDSKNVFAIKFDNKGTSIMISTFNLNDEYNILNMSKKIKDEYINFKIVNNKKIITDTREELEQKRYILNIINKLSFDTIQYIYYDCFNKKISDHKLMLKEIIKSINKNIEICNKIYNILKPIYSS